MFSLSSDIFFKLALLVFHVELHDKGVQKNVGFKERLQQPFQAVQKQPKPYKAYYNANTLKIR